MKKNIRIRFKREIGGYFYNKVVSVVLLNQNNVQDLINMLKSNLEELQYFELLKEELYFGTQLMKPDESVPDETAIKLELIVK